MNNKLFGMDFGFDGVHERVRGYLKEIILGGDSEFLWKARSVRLLDIVIDALAELKKANGCDVTLRMIYDCLSLDGLINLGVELRKSEIDTSKISPIESYLSDLPGFCVVDGKYSEINKMTRQQQGYVSLIVINSIHYLANQMEEDMLK